MRPHADAVVIVTADARVDMQHEHRGIWVAVLPRTEVPDYTIDVRYDGVTIPADDPYRFLPTLGGMDIHLIQEGRHEQLWDVLGAHVRDYTTSMGTVTGVSFAVWAPSAQGVRVAGDFNYWDATGHPMRSLGSCGVWELFVPRVGDATLYKFEILGRDGVWRRKADPWAFATEVPPATGSIVFSSAHTWHDDEWLRHRAEINHYKQPMSIYEVHLGSWRPGLSYRQLAAELTAY
ncbi:MAG: hypothetical protein ORN20_02295, partial [Candidatus Nanopelagicales bacterium]|nr:hypothetical protein [Candidatus Nanopelagicales bacterium]